ncbi:MAG: transcription antitermination factor NusB [Nitrospina sp.]|nr:transcription antitermination factor NusB [Nitrospina sp.]
MGKRRSSRELAVRFLYLCEMNTGEWREQLDQYWERNPCQPDICSFTENLLEQIFDNKKEIDQLIEKFSDNFTLSRMGIIDRNILRLAVSEILYFKQAPPAVVINEAVEIAKRYGSDESPGFINAVLDKIRAELKDGPVPSPQSP